jgi:hypothetical protein
MRTGETLNAKSINALGFQMTGDPDSMPLKKASMDFMELEAYIKVMEAVIEAMKHKEVLDIELVLKDGYMHLDEIDFDTTGIELSWPMSEPLTGHLRAATLISQYSLLEENLINFCEYLSQKCTKKFNRTARVKSSIDHAMRYLSSSLHVNLSKTDVWWDEIIQVRRVRNLIVHQNGYIRSEQEKKGIPEHGTLSKLIGTAWMQRKVILGKGINQYMNRVILGFFYTLHEALKESGYLKEDS